MVDRYSTLVGAEVLYRDEPGAWLSNEANHRIALLAFPSFVDDSEKDTRTGMQHSGFEYASFEGSERELCASEGGMDHAKRCASTTG